MKPEIPFNDCVCLEGALFDWRQRCPRAVRARRITETEVAHATGVHYDDVYAQTMMRHQAFVDGRLR